MIRTAAFLFALLAPVPALALSCVAPSIEQSYGRFAQAQETYIVVHGRVAFDESALPDGLSGDRKPPKLTRLSATLVGKSLGKQGFLLPFDQEVTLEVSCLGPWCGKARNGEDVLAFLRQTETGYALAVPPCGGVVFGAPKPEQLEKVQQCFQNGGCS